jgi:hypothetical protein
MVRLERVAGGQTEAHALRVLAKVQAERARAVEDVAMNEAIKARGGEEVRARDDAGDRNATLHVRDERSDEVHVREDVEMHEGRGAGDGGERGANDVLNIDVGISEDSCADVCDDYSYEPVVRGNVKDGEDVVGSSEESAWGSHVGGGDDPSLDVRAERGDEVRVREDVEAGERSRAREHVERGVDEGVNVNCPDGLGTHISEEGGDDASVSGRVEDDDVAQADGREAHGAGEERVHFADEIDTTRARVVSDICIHGRDGVVVRDGGGDVTRGDMCGDLNARMAVLGDMPSRCAPTNDARAACAADVRDTRERRAVRTAALLSRGEERVRDRTRAACEKHSQQASSTGRTERTTYRTRGSS